MVNLSKIVKEQIDQAPRQFLEHKLKICLKKKDIDNDEMTKALAAHIIGGSSEPFEWDDGQKGPANHQNIDFTDEEKAEINNSLNMFIENDLPKVLTKSIKKCAKILTKDLTIRWPEYHIDEQCNQESFKRRLEIRWSKGLNSLRMMLSASREIGQIFAEKLARSKAKRGILKREALMLLHTRTCQTTTEVLVLLENGLADGAYARWRTLHEISVVAFLVDRFGDEIAERYLMHDKVTMRESLKNDFRHQGMEYSPEELDDESQSIEMDFQSVIKKYGKSFASPYGWAAFSLDIKKPRFQDLEKAVNWDAISPDYKWSSFKIHAGAAGTIRSLGGFYDEGFVIGGSSNAGLETPAINTAYSLLHVTSLMFGNIQDIEQQIQMQSLIKLRNRVVKKCRKAAKKLLRDEFDLR